jgi:hypothetical protein
MCHKCGQGGPTFIFPRTKQFSVEPKVHEIILALLSKIGQQNFVSFNDTYFETVDHHSMPICSKVNFIEMSKMYYKIANNFMFTFATACI